MIMTNEQIIEMYENPNVKSIYGFMYGTPFLNCCNAVLGDHWEIDKVIKINKKKLRLTKDKKSFIFVWGWPGPDYNVYDFNDYGKTWVFADKELKE